MLHWIAPSTLINIAKQFPLYIRTLQHLRTTQILALLRKRFVPSRMRGLQVQTVHLRAGVKLHSPIPYRSSQKGDQLFCFLNQEKRCPNGHIDWIAKDMPKLWRYNLHYFDYLFDSGRSYDASVSAISDWLSTNSAGTGDGWEPYTLSLRIVNWIKFFLCNESTIQQEWLLSLYEQALWLEGNLEYHILANHFLKNGVALFFVGLYFEGVDADRWLQKGYEILCTQLEEQFLADGGHYERSPMYHSICVVDYLDVLNVMKGSKAVRMFDAERRFKHRIDQALDFLHDICLPDGEIPLFNDSAFRIAPSPSDIMTYAKQVSAYSPPVLTNDLSTKEKRDTGYYVIRDGTNMMIIDCGAVGPEYQPGHAHADTLSFELAVNGQRIIVDSGVHDYEPGFRRAYLRSTKAHNTVCVDRQDQSETWGVFRVARRAKPLPVRLMGQTETRVRFEGAHDGYSRLPGRLIHKRIIDYTSPGEWVVSDTLEGKGIHTIESYIHVHPSYRVCLASESAEVRDQTDQIVLTISVAPNLKPVIQEGLYCPEFGKALPCSTLVMGYRGAVPVTLQYQMNAPLRGGCCANGQDRSNG